MTTPQATPNQSQNKNCFLWGCGIVLVLFCLLSTCLAIGLGLALIGVDLRGTNLEEGINIIPWGEFLEDPANIQDLPEFLFGDDDPVYEDGETKTEGDSYQPPPADEIAPGIEAAPGYTPYTAADFNASFLYPEGWDIEVEDYRITFYDPNSYTYLYAGMDEVDASTTASQVSNDVIETLETEAEEGSLVVVENGPYYVPTGDDAYLNAYEWTDLEGDFYWAYDLEIISGNANIFFFLVGQEHEEFQSHRQMIEVVADSFFTD